MLPGLNVGVDSKGQVVQGSGSAQAYNGPIAISLVLDPNINAATYSLIEKSMPELAGGLRDSDEFKISRGTLRQLPAPNNNAPQVNINNQPPSNDSNGHWTESAKIIALMVILGGLLLWVMSHLLKQAQGADPQRRPENQNSPRNELPPEAPIDTVGLFETIEPRFVGLYLLKALNARKNDQLMHWVKLTSPAHHRQVLLTFPGWVALSIEKTIEAEFELENKHSVAASEKVPTADAARRLFREIAVLEQNLKEVADQQRSFLLWFPATFLRQVPTHQRLGISESSKKVLWLLRPDLGDFTRMDNIDLANTFSDASPIEVAECFHELSQWGARGFVAEQNDKKDIVQTWATIINQLNEFGPIDSQLKQAQQKLESSDYSRLVTLVASVHSPIDWASEQRREWLRFTDPQDFYYWTSLVSTPVEWDMSKELRPMRRAMFETAKTEALYQKWSEEQKKAAARRLIEQFRKIQSSSGATFAEVA